jgi:hypothetical protein
MNITCFLLSIVLFLFALFLPTQNSVETVSNHDTYHVSAHHSKELPRSLVDRGANGGIAGSDCRIISYSDRTVDATGIANHQLTSIKIGTVGAYAKSQWGPVIIVMNQYAIFQQFRTIHSCVQLKHFKNEVHDRSGKVGGLQRITTNDGYVFPLDIIGGLPYLKMRPYTDTEFDTLPHVVLTSDRPFRHSVFDCTLSDKHDWYDNITNWSEGMGSYPFHLDGTYKHLEPDIIEANLHDMLLLNDRFIPDLDLLSDDESSVGSSMSVNYSKIYPGCKT